MAHEKPERVEIGKAYRMSKPVCRCPSDEIALVTAINKLHGELEIVEVEWLLSGRPWRSTTYSAFLRMVYSEAPTAIH